MHKHAHRQAYMHSDSLFAQTSAHSAYEQRLHCACDKCDTAEVNNLAIYRAYEMKSLSFKVILYYLLYV